MPRTAPKSAVLALLATVGCGHDVKLPAGASCAKTVSAGPGVASLRDALASAQSGTCVVAAPGQYAGAFMVPPGAVLAADVGTTVEVTGEVGINETISLAKGATLSGVHVKPFAGTGVAIASGGGHLLDVVVEGAPVAGVVAWCEEDCLVADLTELEGVQLLGNATGLLAHGARVKVTGGRVSGNKSFGLTDGYGVVASVGATLQMVDTVVDDNEALGLLIDGAMGTQATLSNLTIKDNRGRGLWAQGLLGTAAAPKLTMSACTVEHNTLAGIGARSSSGLVIQGGRVASTVVGRTQSTTSGQVDVGDGIGLFEATADVLVDGVALEQNGRSQMLVDLGSTGLKVQGGSVTSGAGQQGIVVQHTVAAVDAPNITVPAAGAELPIAAPLIAVPTR